MGWVQGIAKQDLGDRRTRGAPGFETSRHHEGIGIGGADPEDLSFVGVLTFEASIHGVEVGVADEVVGRVDMRTALLRSFDACSRASRAVGGTSFWELRPLNRGMNRALTRRCMGVATENETQRTGQVGSTLTCYRLHVPRGRELSGLPAEYESVEAAKRAFERTRGVARWCLVEAHVPGRDEEPRFVLQALVRNECVIWNVLLQTTAPQAPSPIRPGAAIQEQRMTNLLAPRLGFFTAEEVVRHLCARFQSADFADEKQLGELREFLRRGLLSYMEPSAAEELAAKCAELG